MLVEIDNPVAVSPTRTFNSFSSEAFVVADNGEFASGRGGGLNDRGGIDINADSDGLGDLNPERIQIQFDPDVSGGAAVPGLNVGDVLDNVTGVVNYNFGNFEVVATEQVTFTSGGLTEETTEIAGSEDALTFATYNVLNLTSSTAVEGGTADPDALQRAELASQIVNNLGSPDIIALQEIQDNDGVNGGDNLLTSDSSQTLQDLVDAIAAAGGPTYTFVDVFDGADAAEFTSVQGGVPSGNIRNGFLYNADRVEMTNLIALTPTQLTNFGVDNPDAFEGSRVPLLGAFEFNGEEVTIINNHLSSRFGSTPIYGGPQPFVQAGEDEREQQALANNQVVDAILALDPSANVIVAGDLNTFEFTDELTEDLPGVGGEQVLENLITKVDGDDAYSFIFDGNSQALDHIFATDGLADTAVVDYVHVNVDFNRDDNGLQFPGAVTGSDHEPIVASFFLPEGEEIDGTRGVDRLIGTEGDDEINGLGGSDLIRGLAGDDEINGGSGRDVISGGDGIDEINGENGADTIRGGAGDDELNGGLGLDLILGGEGADMIDGGEGRDRIKGGEGDDELTGGLDMDRFIFQADFGDDIVTDFNGDLIQIRGADADDVTVETVTEGLLLTVDGDATFGSVLLEGIAVLDDSQLLF
jgi:Ca2+-binding RTX toxin-like protein